MPEAVECKAEEDCAENEEDVLKAIDWLHTHVAVENEQNRKKKTLQNFVEENL